MSTREATVPAPCIGVVLVTYNNSATIQPALAALARGSRQRLEVVVVDNNSADDTVRVIKEDFPEVHLVASTVNQGFAAGSNLGADRLLEAGVLLFLNPDTIVDPGAIDRAVGHLLADESIGIVGGRTRYGDGTLNPTCCFAEPSLWSAFCYATGLASVARRATSSIQRRWGVGTAATPATSRLSRAAFSWCGPLTSGGCAASTRTSSLQRGHRPLAADASTGQTVFARCTTLA